MGTRAFAVPIKPGKTDEWRRFVGEMGGNRAGEFAEMNKRHGLTRHAAWLQQTPMGDMAIVIHEGPGAEEFMEKLAASEQPLETWMREQVADIHPIDLDDPPPPPELGMDWKA